MSRIRLIALSLFVLALLVVGVGIIFTQSNVPEYSLTGRYSPATPGAGIAMDSLLGPYTESVTVADGTVTVRNRATGAADATTATFAAGADLSDATPRDVGTAAAGTSSQASRSDHAHGGGGPSGASLPESAHEGQCLQWLSGAWTAGACADFLLVFAGLTRAVDYAAVSAVVTEIITAVNTYYFSGNPWHTAEATEPFYGVSVDIDNRRLPGNNRIVALEHIWEMNGTAPYAWILAPAGAGGFDRMSLAYMGTTLTATTTSEGFISINGVLYDLKYAQLTGTRPTFGTGDGEVNGNTQILEYNYTYPSVLSNPN